MIRSHCIPILLLISTFLPCCSSPTENEMSPDARREWQAACEHHGIGLLDDRAFDVLLGPVHKPLEQADTLEFAGGRFHSTACDPYGFGSGAYTTRVVDGSTAFEARCTNAAGDTNDWRGTVRGDAIEGSLTMTPFRGTPVEHRFQSRGTGH